VKGNQGNSRAGHEKDYRVSGISGRLSASGTLLGEPGRESETNPAGKNRRETMRKERKKRRSRDRMKGKKQENRQENAGGRDSARANWGPFVA